jgi:hypothetical protein
VGSLDASPSRLKEGHTLAAERLEPVRRFWSVEEEATLNILRQYDFTPTRCENHQHFGGAHNVPHIQQRILTWKALERSGWDKNLALNHLLGHPPFEPEPRLLRKLDDYLLKLERMWELENPEGRFGKEYGKTHLPLARSVVAALRSGQLARPHAVRLPVALEESTAVDARPTHEDIQTEDQP